MERKILEQICSSRSRIEYLQESIKHIERKYDMLLEGKATVADVVTCGKRGKKVLGTVLIRGVPVPEEEQLERLLKKRGQQLNNEYEHLLLKVTRAEEEIANIPDLEIRNILSLYYVENLTWVQVACRMNEMCNHKKTYTDSSCRRKHDRFLKKNEKNL